MYYSKQDLNFIKDIKKHPSKIISVNLKEGIENKNSPDEIIVVNKDTSRNIFFNRKKMIKK